MEMLDEVFDKIVAMMEGVVRKILRKSFFYEENYVHHI